jgi:integrase
MFRHGLRVSEACRLKLDQVDIDSRIARHPIEGRLTGARRTNFGCAIAARSLLKQEGRDSNIAALTACGSHA